MMNNHSFPTLVTTRLILNRLEDNDIPFIVAYLNVKEVNSSLIRVPYPYAEADAVVWLDSIRKGLAEETNYTFAIRIKSTEEFIGVISIYIDINHHKAEIGYWMGKPHWNKGYTTEALGELMKFAFNELDLHKIYATCSITNPGSRQVMIKNKMILEGELKDEYYTNNKYDSCYRYRLTQDEFLNLNG